MGKWLEKVICVALFSLDIARKRSYGNQYVVRQILYNLSEIDSNKEETSIFDKTKIPIYYLNKITNLLNKILDLRILTIFDLFHHSLVDFITLTECNANWTMILQKWWESIDGNKRWILKKPNWMLDKSLDATKRTRVWMGIFYRI